MLPEAAEDPDHEVEEEARAKIIKTLKIKKAVAQALPADRAQWVKGVADAIELSDIDPLIASNHVKKPTSNGKAAKVSALLMHLMSDS